MSLAKEFKKPFVWIAIVSFLKLVLIFSLPVTGDEAYFTTWGKSFELGYYDHPPMVGWLIYLMSFISSDIAFYRLFSFFATIVVAYIIYLFAKDNFSKERALWVSLIFLSSHVDILLSLFTNDIPLMLFGTVGAYLFYKSLKSESKLLSLLAGVFFGLAFLSKYFAVFLVFSLFLYAIFSYKKSSVKPIMIALLGMMPFVLENIYFNYTSCWNNIMFNFLIRPASLLHPKNLIILLGFIVYIITPWGLKAFYKTKFKRDNLFIMIALILGVVFSVFFVVALKNKVGLHWFLLFLPYMFLLFSYVDEGRLVKIFRYNLMALFLHIIVLLGIVFTPISLFKEKKFYPSLVYATQKDEVCKNLSLFGDDKLFALGYTTASVLSYNCDRKIYMLFNTSKYAREADKKVDVRKLDNKDIVLFNKKPIKSDNIKKCCKEFSLDSFEVKGAKFYLGRCRGFNYKAYKKLYLEEIDKRYYSIPKWLPFKKCYFKDMYFR